MSISTRAASKRSRRRLLKRTDRPPLRYRCTISESALRTVIGSPAIMRRQTEHWSHFNLTSENVIVQVMPFDGGPHAFLGMIATSHRFPPPAPDILLTDSCGRETVPALTGTRHGCRYLRHLKIEEGGVPCR